MTLAVACMLSCLLALSCGGGSWRPSTADDGFTGDEPEDDATVAGDDSNGQDGDSPEEGLDSEVAGGDDCLDCQADGCEPPDEVCDPGDLHPQDIQGWEDVATPDDGTDCDEYPAPDPDLGPDTPDQADEGVDALPDTCADLCGEPSLDITPDAGDSSVPEPAPEPAPDPVAEPVPEPAPEPAPEPVPEPVPEPAPEPAPEPVPEPVPEPAPEPVPEPAPEPLPDPTPDIPVTETGAEVAPCPECAAYGKAATTGTLANDNLKELSGLGASRIHDGIYYAHNDSGDSARFFAFDLKGTHRGEFKLASGASAYDWEDLSVGPCGSGWCVYIGDIGDNFLQRTKYVVYVVPEPDKIDQPSPVTVSFTALPYVYPDKPRNSETILVHTKTGDIYIVIKTSAAWDVFKFPTPHQPGVTVTLLNIGTVKLPGSTGPLSTGGDIHPCGTRVLLRSYGDLWEYTLLEGQAFDAIFGNPPKKVPFASEPQGEAACYDADGLGYITASEGAGAAIHQVRCQ